MVEVTLERLPAGYRQRVRRFRHPSLEGFRTRDVAGFFELPGMNAQVSIRGLQQPLELVERQRLVGRQRTHDSKPHTLVDETIERRRRRLRRAALDASKRLLFSVAFACPAPWVWCCAVPSHRASSRSGYRTRRGPTRTRRPSATRQATRARTAPRRPAP